MTKDEFWALTEPEDYRTVEYVSYFDGEIHSVSGPVRPGSTSAYFNIDTKGLHEPEAIDYKIVRRVG